MFCFLVWFPLWIAADSLAPPAGFPAHLSRFASEVPLRRLHLANSRILAGPPVLASITAHLNLQDDEEDTDENEETVAGNHADSALQESEESSLSDPSLEEGEALDHENKSEESEDTQETSEDAEENDKHRDPECRREEKALEQAEEKIARAQEELNKEEIKEEVAEAAELEKRADLISQTESEEAEEEQISEEV